MKTLLSGLLLIIATTLPAGATCLSLYGCTSSGSGRYDLRDQSGAPDLYGNRYESPYLRQQQRDTYERQQYDQRNRALGSEYNSYGQPRYRQYGY